MERKLVLYYRLVTGLIGLLTLGLVIMSVQLWYVGRSVVALNQALLEIHRVGQHSAAVTREVAGRLLTGRPVVAAALEECPVVQDLERLASAVRGDRHLEGLVWETTRQHRSIHNVLTLLETTASGLRPGDGRVEASRYFTEELLPAVSGLDALLARIQETLTSRLEGMWAGYRIFHWLVTAGGLAFTVAGLIFLAVFQRSIARTLTQPLARIFGLVEQAVKAEVPAGRPGDAEGEIVRLEKLVDLAARVYFRDEEAVNEIFTLWADKLGEVDFNALIQDTLAVLYNRGIILGGAYYRYDDEGERLELAVRYALPAEVETEVLPGHGPAGQCARELRVMVGWQEFDLGHGLTPRTRVKVVAAPLGLEELRGVLLVLVPAEDGDREHLIRLFTRLSRLLSLLQEKHERETERKELLEEISRQARTAEEKLAHVQAVLESSLDGICTVDREGRITAWNRGAEVITGYTAAEAIGRPCREVLGHTYTSGEPICGSHDCVLCRAFDGENVEGMEALLRTKDNRRLPIRISAAPVRVGEGGIKEIVQVFHDLTEVKTYIMELEKANRAKSEFLATMSHELRTPLNAIIGFAELLGEVKELSREKLGRYAGNILRAGRHLLSLVNDVLDLSKIEAGRLEWEREAFNPVALLENVALLLRDRAAEGGVRVNMKLSPDLPAVAYGDERKLKQVMYNLLGNALKFTPAGGEVGMEAWVEGEELKIAVWDEGPGVPPDKLDTIFEPFVQADPSFARSRQGSGLGLAIVKRFIELGGGRVEVSNRPGGGALFTVSLPLRHNKGEIALLGAAAVEGQPPAEPAPGPAGGGEDGTPHSSSSTCVIVEDDPLAAEMLGNYYRRLGYVPLVAPDSSAFWAIMERETPCFISLDILLPGNSGWEILTALREEPRWRSVPVVVVSVLPEVQKGLALGADEYLVKPVGREELYFAVHRALARRMVAAGRPVERGGRVLIIDDEPEAVEIMAGYLRCRGLEVAWAYSAETGRKKAMGFRPDVIILDLLMPEAGGFVFLKWQQEDPQLRDIPVIVVTSKQLSVAERQELDRLVVSIYDKAELFEEGFWRQLERLLPSGPSQTGDN